MLEGCGVAAECCGDCIEKLPRLKTIAEDPVWGGGGLGSARFQPDDAWVVSQETLMRRLILRKVF
jgi:hypothetical protein